LINTIQSYPLQMFNRDALLTSACTRATSLLHKAKGTRQLNSAITVDFDFEQLGVWSGRNDRSTSALHFVARARGSHL